MRMKAECTSHNVVRTGLTHSHSFIADAFARRRLSTVGAGTAVGDESVHMFCNPF